MVIIAGGKEIPCVRAEKGTNFIRGYDSGGNIVFEASKISDFSRYQINGGLWEAPLPTLEEQLRADVDFLAVMGGVAL